MPGATSGLWTVFGSSALVSWSCSEMLPIELEGAVFRAFDRSSGTPGKDVGSTVGSTMEQLPVFLSAAITLDRHLLTPSAVPTVLAVLASGPTDRPEGPVVSTACSSAILFM